MNTQAINDIPIEMCDYNDAQLLDVISHLLRNYRNLANALDGSRPDVAQVIDAIIDHPDMDVDTNLKPITESGLVGNKVITLDRRHNKFIAFNSETAEVIAEAPALDLKGLEKKMRKMRMIK